MNRPDAVTRAMGSRAGAFLMLLVCIVAVGGVFIGELPWWLALLAFGMASGTVSAGQQMRAYNAWAAQWNEMAGNAAAPPPPRKKKNPVLDNAVGVMAVAALPWLASQVGERWEKQFIGILWLVVCVVLVFRAVRAIVRRLKARRMARSKAEAQQASAQVQPVAWLVDPAASSPSRADAMRELPEYSARLMGQG
jgi:hypothetical protein